MRKKKGIFSKIIVSAVIALNVLFTIVVLIIFLKTSCEPSGLIIAWFSFTTVELWSLAGIKKAKFKETTPQSTDVDSSPDKGSL